jgi:hypothetical protein
LIVGRAYENRDIDAGLAMRTFQMPAVFMFHRRWIVLFDMRAVMTMFMSKRLQGDVPICTYAKRKLTRCIARHEYVNEQNNEY